MKISVIIPTYWTSNDPKIQHQTPDAVYDHPTPLESRSTLPRLLSNLRNTDMPKKSTTITVITALTHKTLEEKAEEKIRQILSKYEDQFEINQFSTSTLKKINAYDKNLAQLLSLYGYSNVRNIGLITAQILKSDILVFLDDDVVINDQKYFHKAQEHVGKNIDNATLGGVAGYYTNKDDSYYLYINPKAWWKTGWPKERKMNEAFKILEKRETLVPTTFAFGGNMVLHWKMFENVPFDPYITRGEDMDLLVNCKMLGFQFMLDTRLRVLHLPGEGKKLWSEMRQDLHRFLYMREKLLHQKEMRNSQFVSPESLKPYPGFFLQFGTLFKFATSSCLNSAHSFFSGSLESFKEFTYNLMQIPSALRFAREYCLDYFEFQKKWSNHVPKTRNNKRLRAVLSG